MTSVEKSILHYHGGEDSDIDSDHDRITESWDWSNQLWEAGASKEDSSLEKTFASQEQLVHIRIQQRNGRKTLTTVQGISQQYDLKKIVKACKKEFACNGTVIEHPEYGEVIQLQGDQRQNIKEFLKSIKIVPEINIKVHGF